MQAAYAFVSGPLAWLAFLISAFFGLISLLRNKDPAVFASTAAALAAFFLLLDPPLDELGFLLHHSLRV